MREILSQMSWMDIVAILILITGMGTMLGIVVAKIIQWWTSLTGEHHNDR